MSVGIIEESLSVELNYSRFGLGELLSLINSNEIHRTGAWSNPWKTDFVSFC